MNAGEAEAVVEKNEDLAKAMLDGIPPLMWVGCRRKEMQMKNADYSANGKGAISLGIARRALFAVAAFGLAFGVVGLEKNWKPFGSSSAGESSFWASIRQSRERQVQAMKRTLQNGILAYKVQKNEWPGQLEKWADQEHDGTIGYLSNSDDDAVMYELLRASSSKSAKRRVMDPENLMVIPSSGSDGELDCMDYRPVTTKNYKHAKRMKRTATERSPDQMTVVYPKKDDGKAYRYVIEYNVESDEVTVMTQGEFNSKVGHAWRGGEEWRRHIRAKSWVARGRGNGYNIGIDSQERV